MGSNDFAPAAPTLSLCMIVRNEEANISRCLESIQRLVDDIVVVDTGSSDRTMEIARSFGARLFSFPWQDDFSLARNFSLEQAIGDWILVIDGDESIAARDHAAIRELIGRDDLDAVTSLQRHYFSSGSVIGWQPGPGGYDEGRSYPGFVDVACRRLFRNRPWLCFENRVHEELVSTDPARPLSQLHSTLVIHHYGKAGDLDRARAKGEAYLQMGLRKVEESPTDPQAHYELGTQYRELDQPGQALACYQQVLALSPGFRDTQLRIGLCHYHLGQQQQALDALRRAGHTLPHKAAEIALATGNVYTALNDLTAAERAFRRAIADDPGLAVASVNLAQLYAHQGRHAEALGSLGRALDRCPGHAELLGIRGQVRRIVGDHEGAPADLEQLGAHPEALRLRARLLVQLGRFHDARRCLPASHDDSDAEVASLRGAVALGLGEVDASISHLCRSLKMHSTLEAAMNLATALQAKGDPASALVATAEALRVSPEEPAALTRFSQLAGHALREPAPRDHSGRFTLFFYQPRSIAFDARTPRTRGLGGTESAVVYLADALAKRGHRIVVFNHSEEPGQFGAVEYARWETMPARCLTDRPDVVVGVRAWQMVGRARFAPLQMFWTGDAYDQPFVERLADSKARAEIDVYMMLSDWQAETFEKHHKVPRGQIVRTRYGIAASMSEAAVTPPDHRGRTRRLAYASTPFRGLDVLLQVFPRIRAACPDAELDIFSSMKVYGMEATQDQKYFGALYRKARQPGVNLIGSVPQLELAARLQQARVLANPNHYPETFCIAAVEAQAAGCVVVTSELGALPQTVGDGGICLPGDPHSAPYQRAFVETCIDLLTNDERWQATSARAFARAWSDYTWTGIAGQWELFCRTALGLDTSSGYAA